MPITPVAELLPDSFSPDSRVWIYQSSRLLSLPEALDAEARLTAFTAQWKSHGIPVKGHAALLFGWFVVFLADETATGVSGCSTDSSVRLVRELEQAYGVDLFHRDMLAFLVKEKIQLIPLAQVDYALEHGFISPDTLYFNNTVLSKKEMDENWLIPMKNSWLKSRYKL